MRAVYSSRTLEGARDRDRQTETDRFGAILGETQARESKQPSQSVRDRGPRSTERRAEGGGARYSFGEAPSRPRPRALASRRLLRPPWEARGWESPAQAPTQPVGCFLHLGRASSQPLRPRPPGGAQGEVGIQGSKGLRGSSGFARLLVRQVRGGEGVRLC